MKKLWVILSVVFLCGQILGEDLASMIKKGDLNAVKAMIQSNPVLLNKTDEKGNTPLHISAESGHIKITEYLLDRGADINSVNNLQSTPLHEAITNGKDGVSMMLIEKGANLQQKDISGKTPLHKAARHNRLKIAELLISKGVDIDSRDQHQRTPLLLLTLMTENVDIARLLIEKGADINAREAFGNMPLNQVAYYSGSLELINLLLDNKADFNADGNAAKNMLAAAARIGSVRLFNYVIKKKEKSLFNIEPWNKYFMRCAINGGSIEIVKNLQKRKIAVHVKEDILGRTPLHYAASHNKAAMFEFLVKKGADINKRDNSGKSAYNLAEQKGYKDLLNRILALGGSSEPQKFPVLTSPYFGQTPPETGSKIFAPGIIFSNHSSVSISPDGQEMYWGSGSSIMSTKKQKGQWTQPEVVSFSGRGKGDFYDDVPFVSPDNKKMFFTSRRPTGSSEAKKENIWYVDRSSSGWSNPKPVSATVNAMSLHWQISVSNSGTLYFAGKRGEDGFGRSDIYYSPIVNGEYTKPVNIGAVINSKNAESSPFIAPDESYIIFSKVVSGRGKLHISFKLKNGEWQKPVRILPDSENANCPVISTDGKYMFYLEHDSIKWVEAKFLKELKTKRERKRDGTGQHDSRLTYYQKND